MSFVPSFIRTTPSNQTTMDGNNNLHDDSSSLFAHNDFGSLEGDADEAYASDDDHHHRLIMTKDGRGSTSSPTLVAEMTEEEQKGLAASKAAMVSEVSEGVDLLDQLESHYRLSRRLTEACEDEDGAKDESGSREESDGNKDDSHFNGGDKTSSTGDNSDKEDLSTGSNSMEENKSATSSAGEKMEKHPSSPKSWMERRMRFGESLTKEEALELTVEKLTRQLTNIMEERDALQSTVHTLEGRVEAQQAKIEALEFFFRKVNNRDEDVASITSATSFSSSGSFKLNNEDGSSRRDGEDEAWDLEGAAPKLSWSFKRTNKKMNSAKIRAAKKMAQITCV